jgi:glycosyltransferase involved in cell wall biosynthesis
MSTIDGRPLRVVLFSETFLPKLDGVVTVMCLLLDHFRERGIEALMVSGGEHVESYNGFPVISITPSVPMPMYPEIRMTIAGRETFRRIQEFDPDIIHIASPMHTGLTFMSFAKRLNKPLVMSFHTHIMSMVKFYGLGFLSRPLWTIHRYVYNKAMYRWATSKRVQEELLEHGFGRTGLWRRGVDPDVFKPGPPDPDLRARLTEGNPEKTLLVFVGRLAPEKQVEQIKPVLEAIPNTHLAIVGDGPFRKNLERIFADMPVTFTGYLERDEVSEVYRAADVFTFPSAIETFGLVVAEAMSTGLPVVSSDVGGVREIIEHGANSYIFEPGDTETMIQYVRELAENPEKRHEMGDHALNAVKHLTWPAIMDELVADYHQLIEEYNQTQQASIPASG